MLLLMLDRRMPIDMVLTADTGMEFPEMYEHLAKLDEHLYRERGSAGKRSVCRYCRNHICGHRNTEEIPFI